MAFSTNGCRDGWEVVGFEVSDGGEVFSTDHVGLAHAVSGRA